MLASISQATCYGQAASTSGTRALPATCHGQEAAGGTGMACHAIYMVVARYTYALLQRQLAAVAIVVEERLEEELLEQQLGTVDRRACSSKHRKRAQGQPL